MTSLRDGVYELKIERDGLLPLTRELAERLDFQEGDRLAFDAGPASVRIESYREFVRGLEIAAEGEMRSAFFAEFLSRLIMAFVNEPVAGRYATSFSRLGLYSLFVGSILHVGTGLRSRRA